MVHLPDPSVSCVQNNLFETSKFHWVGCLQSEAVLPSDVGVFELVLYSISSISVLGDL